MNEIYVWLSAALACVLLEMGHPGLFLFLSFACGSVIGAVCAYLGYGYIVQAASALVASMMSFVMLTMYLRYKGLLDGHKVYPTNVYALIGKEGKVIKKIEPLSVGLVKVGGQVWSARSVHDVSIAHDAVVRIVGISGVHLIVQEE